MKTLFPGVSETEARHFLEAADWDLNTGLHSRVNCLGFAYLLLKGQA